MKTKSNKREYICFYVMDDGRPKTLMRAIASTDIAEASVKFVDFIKNMYKKEGKEFTADSISSFTIMPKPMKGRKKVCTNS
jgi:hypothetical protein